MEKMCTDFAVYHKQCFRCTHCNRVLSFGNYTANGVSKLPYCKQHFLQLFKEKGNYDEGFGMEKKSKAMAIKAAMDGHKSAEDLTTKKVSKWDKPKISDHPEPVNRLTADSDNGTNEFTAEKGAKLSESNGEMPLPSTTRNMLAKYSSLAADGAAAHTSFGGCEKEEGELPEEGTTKSLLAKFSKLQSNDEELARSAAPKKQVKLYEDDQVDSKPLRQQLPEPSPRSVKEEAVLRPSDTFQQATATIEKEQNCREEAGLNGDSSLNGGRDEDTEVTDDGDYNEVHQPHLDDEVDEMHDSDHDQYEDISAVSRHKDDVASHVEMNGEVSKEQNLVEIDDREEGDGKPDDDYEHVDETYADKAPKEMMMEEKEEIEKCQHHEEVVGDHEEEGQENGCQENELIKLDDESREADMEGEEGKDLMGMEDDDVEHTKGNLIEHNGDDGKSRPLSHHSNQDEEERCYDEDNDVVDAE